LHLLTYLLNVDINIDIAIFHQYRIDTVLKAKKRYRSITNSHCTGAVMGVGRNNPAESNNEASE